MIAVRDSSAFQVPILRFGTAEEGPGLSRGPRPAEKAER
jgi:hypothetical protein